MRFFIFILVALSLSFAVEGKVWAVIDTFATRQTAMIVIVANGDAEVPPFVWYSPYGEDDNTAPEVAYHDTTDALGGQRDVILGYQTDSASGAIGVIAISQLACSISFPLDWNGGAYIQYDGSDNGGSDAAFPGSILNSSPGIGSANNPFGLSGGRMDFTFAGRAQVITMTVQADHEVFYYMDALDSSGVKNTVERFIAPSNDNTLIVFEIPFTSSEWNNLATFSWENVVAFQVRALTFENSQGLSQAVDTSFKFLNITGYEIAGRVVVDCLCSGTDDSFRSGAAVSLFNAANTLLDTTTSDGNGQFFFYGFGDGSYKVCLDASILRCSTTPQCTNIVLDNQISPPAIRFATTVASTMVIPSDARLECGACTTPECLGFANVTGCSGLIILSTWNDAETAVGCTHTIRRTWTNPENSQNQTQTITVQDTQAPVIIVPASDLTFTCGSVGTPINDWLSNQAGAQATDCNTVTWSNNYQNNGPTQCGTVTVTFTAHDTCGLTSTTTASYSITDTIAPILDSPATDASAECDTKGTTAQTQFNSWITARAGASATDACDNSLTWTNNNTAGALTSGCNSQRTVTFTANDDCGNRVSTTATFTIQDTQAPTITRQASPATGQCGSGQSSLNTFLNTHGGATATDNCVSNDANLVWTNDFSDLDGTTCNSGTTVTFTVADPCGFSTVTTATFTIQDNTPPTLTRQASPSVVECGSDIVTAYGTWLTNNAGADATDDCTAVSWSNNGTDVTPTQGCSNIYTVEFSARDACNAAAVTTTSTFTVRDNTAPTFTTTPSNSEAECDDGATAAFNTWLSNSASAVATDACGSASITNDFTGTTPSFGCSAVTTVRFTAVDSCGLRSAARTATFTIRDTTAPTIITQPSPASFECNPAQNQQQYNAFLTSHAGAEASDVCSSTVTWTNNATANVQIGCNAVRPVQFTASDGCGNTVRITTTFTIIDTTPPEISQSASDKTTECNNNTGNSQDFNNWLSTRGGATATDSCTGITWSNDFTEFVNNSQTCTSSAVVTFTATDACGAFVRTTATYAIIDSTGPSIVTPAQNQLVQCDGTGNSNQFQQYLDQHGGATAVDACTGANGLVWTNSIAQSPQGCGTVEVTFTVTDPCGSFASTTGTFTVADTSNPTFSTAPSSPRVECDGQGNVDDYQQWVSNYGGAVATDVCSTVITYSSNAPQTGPVGCGVVPVTITAVDSCNNAAQATATFTVVDTSAPAFAPPASDTTVECDQSSNQSSLNQFLSSHGGAQAFDICYADTSLTWTNNFTALTSSGCGQRARVQFTVTDPCGQRAFTTADFVITDTIPPVITRPANDSVFECNLGTNPASISTFINSRAGATAQDACSGVTWTNDYNNVPPTVCGAPVVITFRATDACGNSVTTSASMSIVDTTGPTFVNFPADKRLDCSQSSDSSNTGFPGFSDLCDSNIEITESDSTLVNPDDRFCPGDTVITRTFSMSDSCGNAVSRSQTIVVGIPVGTCIPTPCPPCNQTQFCCESSLVSPPCIPVECNAVPCSSVSCDPVPCLPVTCPGSPPIFEDDDDAIPPSPTPQKPECEPIYIYVFDDEDDSAGTFVPPQSTSSASALTLSLFSVFFIIVALLF